ncbi:MAG: hypothetical protein SGILL_003962 [Bacillariaceae sp.]
MGLCSRGIPDSCPECLVDQLKSQARDPVSDHGLVDSLKNLFSTFPAKDVEILKPKQDYEELETQILEEQIKSQEELEPWSRRSVVLQRIPCYRLLNKKNGHLLSFDPKNFVKKNNLNGLLTKTLSSANLQSVADVSSVSCTLLVGYASIVKVKKLFPKEMPKGKKKSQFANALWGDQYDSLVYKDSNGMESLIVWNPFPVQAVLKVRLTPVQLQVLAELLEGFGVPDPNDAAIEFSKPENLLVIDDNASTNAEEDEEDGDDGDDDSDDDSPEKRVSLAEIFFGTKLQGRVVERAWDGGVASAGLLDRRVEAELVKKMKFLSSDAKPFAALTQLQALVESESYCPLLHLLIAAENIAAKSVDDALAEFDLYLAKSFKEGKALELHPWSIVVAARLDTENAKQLLVGFAKLFPRHVNVLSKDEQEVVNGVELLQDEEAQSWTEKFRNQWSSLKNENHGEVTSDATDELLELIGLRKVKEESLRLWKAALQLKKMDLETRKENPITANYCFLGNPGKSTCSASRVCWYSAVADTFCAGTGKTTVARLFASILCDSGVRSNSVFVEITAQEAKDGGPDEFRKTIASAMGGVLFIDEAYDLDPVGDLKGKPIVNELLTLCENERDNISVILAGYEDDFEKKFFAYNEGLKSRFTSVTFDDFDETELATIWNSMRSKKKWAEEDGVCRVVVKRLCRSAGKKGFGNAREVRKRLEKATQEAMARLGNEFSQDKMMLQISDVIGEDPRLSNEKLAKVRKEIDEKIGWKRIKDQVEELLRICGVNYGRELMGKPQLDVFLNRMFLGNPGTGKTTCAKLYGRLLKELGFLSNGDVISKTASDFVGEFIGQSQKNTNRILDSAKGKVLIIDEAYALNDGLFGTQVLDTLVEKVQGQPSDDMAVLLLGYEEQMLEMIRKQNPGLNRRFPKDQAFYFDDYDENELLEILELNAMRHEVKMTTGFRRKALEILAVQRKQPNFGNAGSVEILMKSAMVKTAERSENSEDLLLDGCDIQDVGVERGEKEEDPLSILDKLYRMEEVKAKLQKMSMTWEVSKREGDEDPKLGHFVFTGSPGKWVKEVEYISLCRQHLTVAAICVFAGTGKTTVARAIANVLFSLGLLPSNKIVETSALDLQANYLGQTSTKVEEAFQEANGGVLFIDEAYNLGVGPFGKEACDSVVAGMTSTKFKDVVVVIAGYPKDIHEMLRSNSGLKSRFTHFFEFPDWKADDCVAFFDMLATKNGFELKDGVKDEIAKGCTKLMALDGWGNGRDVTQLWSDTKSTRDARVYSLAGFPGKTIEISDVEEAIRNMLSARNGPESKPDAWEASMNKTPKFAFDHGDQCAPKTRAKTEEASKTDATEETSDILPSEEQEEDEEQVETSAPSAMDDGRDEGVPDDIWEELQRLKQEEEARQREYEEEQRRLEEFKKEQEELERLLKEQERLEAEKAAEIARLKAEAEEEERRRLEEELRKLEEQRRREEERLRQLEADRRRREDMLRKQEEERRKLQAIKEKLQQISPCPMGFSWFKQDSGWLCGGGGHYVSDDELRRCFGVDC